MDLSVLQAAAVGDPLTRLVLVGLLLLLLAGSWLCLRAQER